MSGCLGLTRLHVINFILKKTQMIKLNVRGKIKFHVQLTELKT